MTLPDFVKSKLMPNTCIRLITYIDIIIIVIANGMNKHVDPDQTVSL